MDDLTTALKTQADVTQSITNTVAANVADALGGALSGKREDGVNARQQRLYNAMRNRLFAKFVGIDHEVAMTQEHREDKLKAALG